MVTKLEYRSAKDGSRDSDPDRVIYTGTTASYAAHALRESQAFQHQGKPVCLCDNVWVACSYALKRSEFYGDPPLLLIVDRQRLSHDPHYDGVYWTDGLPVGSFLPYQFSPDACGKMRPEDLDEMDHIGRLLLGMTSDEIRERIINFLEECP